MQFVVRCKYYVSAVETRKYEHIPENEPYVTVHFNAVMSKEEGTENHSYWTASPSGGMKLSGKLSELEQYAPGTYWYIDFLRLEWDLKGCDIKLAKADVKSRYMEKSREPNIWQLRKMEVDGGLNSYNISIHRYMDWQEVQGEFNVSISNSKVWSQYTMLGDLYEMSIHPATK